MMQWHPIFAQLLRRLVESYYDVQAGVAVGDAPRLADIVLLRRTSDTPPPFQGLWRWLTPWSVLEFKGPTVSARVAHLDALVELGLGIRRRLNEERARQRQGALGREDVSFWYLTNHLGRRFLRDARELLGELESAGAGVWRATVMHHPVFLVSARALPVEFDTVPLHVLAKESRETRLAVVKAVADNERMWRLYGGLLAMFLPEVYEEAERMARKKGFLDVTGLRPVIQSMPRKDAIKEMLQELGVEEIVAEVGVKELLARLTPEQRAEALRELQQSSPRTK